MIQHLKSKPLPEGAYWANGRQCFSTGKVLIGLLYQQPVRDIGTEAERVQSALLNHQRREDDKASWRLS